MKVEDLAILFRTSCCFWLTVCLGPKHRATQFSSSWVMTHENAHAVMFTKTVHLLNHMAN